MKERIFCFDIDDTLAKNNEEIKENIIEQLNILSTKSKVILVSGKSISYIQAITRQAKTKTEYLIGENGGSIFIGNKFPPKNFKLLASIELNQELKEKKIKN